MEYAKDLVTVMSGLEDRALDYMGGIGKVGPEAAATLVNSRSAFIQMLQEAGYNDLAADYVSQYGLFPEATAKSFAARGLPSPKFTTISAETFTGMARIDLQGFSAIGIDAMDKLRLGVYRQTVAGLPFSEVVKTVRDATVGTSVKGSPLSNYAYTHANTAVLAFNGEVTKEAGDSIGFDSPDSLWEVIGPEDDATRDVCLSALGDPVRTRQEWIDAGYFGGAPGGFNCRHELVPYLGEDPR
jgi:hypothetical protein